jgi:hypothetical protein
MLPGEIKRALREAGFEVYRTEGNEVHLAERVRENLIMDSGVRVIGPDLGVAVVTRAQLRDFPGDAPEQLFARARGMAQGMAERGYREMRAFVTPVRDPSEPSRTLDHWYEIRFEKPVGDVATVLEEVRLLQSLAKTAQR